MAAKEGVKTGVTFTNMLLLLFVALKLTGHIAWSWWWVLSPVWIPLAFAAVCLALLGLVMIAEKLFRHRNC